MAESNDSADAGMSEDLGRRFEEHRSRFLQEEAELGLAVAFERLRERVQESVRVLAEEVARFGQDLARYIEEERHEREESRKLWRRVLGELPAVKPAGRG